MSLSPPPSREKLPVSNGWATMPTVWIRWFTELANQAVSAATSAITWGSIDKTGSSIASIEQRNHNDLQNIDTDDHAHLYLADRNNLVRGEVTTLHKHTHNVQDGLQGGTTDEYYHNTAHEDALTDIIDTQWSTGILGDGGIITDGGSGTVNIAARSVMIRSTDSDVADINKYSVSAATGQALTDLVDNLIYVEYNSGVPQYIVSLTVRSDTNTNVLVGKVYRNGTTVHIFNESVVRANDNIRRLSRRFVEAIPFQRVEGAILSETGTRNISVTAGIWWECSNRFTTNALNTAVSGTFTNIYSDGVGGWTEQTAQTQIDNTYYDDGSGTLAALTVNRYAVRWIYIESDGDIVVSYGTGDHVLEASANTEAEPVRPHRIEATGRIIGKIVIRQGAATFTSIANAFDPSFEFVAPNNHNALSNLQGGQAGEYYHLTNAQNTDLTDGGNTILHKHDIYQEKAAGEPQGFSDRTEVTLTWVDATRTLTITPVVASYTIWSDGTKYVKTIAESIVIPNTQGSCWVYYDSTGTLVSSTTFDVGIINRYAFVASIEWNATAGYAVPDALIELHGIEMPADVHNYLHNTRGTVYESGLAATVVPDGDGSLLLHAQVSAVSGIIWDEDINHTITSRSVADNIPVLYRLGASAVWTYDETSSAIVRATGTGRAAFNEFTGGAWQLTEVPNGDYVMAHLYAIPGINKKWMIVMGQSSYNTLVAARAAANTELVGITGLPVVEFKAVATIVLQTSNTYTNAVKSRIRTSDTGEDYIDWRSSVPTGSAPSYSHDSLSGINIGDIQHFSATEKTDLTDAGDSALHYHATDRDLANATGTLAIGSGGTGQATATAAFDALAPTTTQGDIIYHNGTDNVRLPKGTAGQILVMNAGATAPEWQAKLIGYTVATLPAGTVGDRAYATDLLTPTYGSVATGGGAVKLPVFFDGTNWVTA